MKNVYRSPYEAYPFLANKPDDLRCDYELMTDLLTSEVGYLRAKCQNTPYFDEMTKIAELVYHANASLRTKVTITAEEIQWLLERVEHLKAETLGRCNKFILPMGEERGAFAHIVRAKYKDVVRLLYRHVYNGNQVEPILFDFFNLASGYFFMLAMKLNQIDEVTEIPFISRNYK